LTRLVYLNCKVGARQCFLVGVGLIELIDLDEAHGCELRFVVINAESSELLRVGEPVLALSGVLNKFVGQDLDDLDSVAGAVGEYLPLVQVFLGVELHPKEGVVFGSKG